MEPEWTKKNISNNTICSYYYIIFIFACIATVISIMAIIMIPFIKGISPIQKLVQIMALMGQIVLALIGTLAAYLLCSRSLLPATPRPVVP